jgi:hypothetical protein
MVLTADGLGHFMPTGQINRRVLAVPAIVLPQAHALCVAGQQLSHPLSNERNNDPLTLERRY